MSMPQPLKRDFVVLQFLNLWTDGGLVSVVQCSPASGSGGLLSELPDNLLGPIDCCTMMMLSSGTHLLAVAVLLFSFFFFMSPEQNSSSQSGRIEVAWITSPHLISSSFIILSVSLSLWSSLLHVPFVRSPPKVIERLISHLQFYDLYYRNTAAAAAVVEQENRGPRLLIALIFQILLLLRIMERTLLFCCCAAVSANGNIFRFSSIPPRNKGT